MIDPTKLKRVGTVSRGKRKGEPIYELPDDAHLQNNTPAASEDTVNGEDVGLAFLFGDLIDPLESFDGYMDLAHKQMIKIRETPIENPKHAQLLASNYLVCQRNMILAFHARSTLSALVHLAGQYDL
jgi:hypothetical protein